MLTNRREPRSRGEYVRVFEVWPEADRGVVLGQVKVPKAWGPATYYFRRAHVTSWHAYELVDWS